MCANAAYALYILYTVSCYTLAMQGQLLTAARPYLKVFSLLTLTLPLSSFGQARYSLRSKLLLAAFACYTCAVLLTAFYTTYINIVVLAWEVGTLQLEDFSNALGMVQKVGYSLMLFTSHASLILQYPRLAAIYLEISALEADIAASSQCHGGQRQRYSFRCRLAMRVGLWIIMVCIFFPRITIPVMRGMSTHDRIITEFILIVLQFKWFEYTLFVVIVHELLLRLRYTLLQLQQELAACEQKILLHVLCLALRENKQLLARIWRLVGELETYFMLPMLLQFLYNGISVLHVVNWAYIQAVNPNDCCRYCVCMFKVNIKYIINWFIYCRATCQLVNPAV